MTTSAQEETAYFVERSTGGIWQQVSTSYADVQDARSHARELITNGLTPVRLVKLRTRTTFQILEESR